MSRAALSPERISAWLDEHGSWAYDGERRVLKRTFTFADFVAAFGFMTVVAIRAQELNHHPDWSNAYHRVDVELTTHSADAVTENDLELAAFMDEWAARCGVKRE
jgi:4a-hydroxytetrahydrobiopterin dehydratase